MSSTTNIDLLSIDEDEITLDHDYDTIIEKILDMDLSHESRINIINTFDDKTTLEIINKINSMYLITGTTLLKGFIISICQKSFIQDILKIECCKILCQKEPTNLNHYKLLDTLITNLERLPIPCKILSIVFLSHCEDLKDSALKHFKNLLNDPFIECDFRYKIILNLDLVNHLDHHDYIIPLLLYFIKNTSIFTTYRIMTSQNLLQNFKIHLSESEINYIYTILYSFSSDQDLDYDLRADATDILLGLGDEHHQKLARDMIAILGNRGKTIFDDQQNIHNVHIDQSTEPILKKIFQHKLNPESTHQNIRQQIIQPIQDQIKLLQDKIDKLNITFNRIDIDRSLYGSVNTTLNTLLCRVHSYITDHTHEQELKLRLEEELIEASGKCSTGYGTRLVNVLSGYDDFNLKISYEDNIQAKLSGRLNKCVREIEDDELRDNILLEMTLCADKEILQRQNFLQFFRQHITDIKQDIWNDVKDDVNDVDFELYFRKAMSKYEGIHFI